MKSPTFGKQRSARGSFSLARALPRLALPSISTGKPRPHPRVGKAPKGGGVRGGRNG